MSGTIRKTTLRSQELSCPTCISKIERELDVIPGVQHVDVRYSSGRIIIQHDPQQAPAHTLIAAVARAGYTAKASAF